MTQDRLEERSLALTALNEAIRTAAMLRTESVVIQAPLARHLAAALRQSQDIEAAARELSRLWFDIEGTGSSSYAADAVRDHGNEFVEAMWRLRAALAPKAEEAPR